MNEICSLRDCFAIFICLSVRIIGSQSCIVVALQRFVREECRAEGMLLLVYRAMEASVHSSLTTVNVESTVTTRMQF